MDTKKLTKKEIYMFLRITFFFIIFALLTMLFHTLYFEESRTKNKEKIAENVIVDIEEKAEQETINLELKVIDTIKDIGREIKN